MIWVLHLKHNVFKEYFAYMSRFYDAGSLAGGFSISSYAL